jgi:AP-2 complex subunit sigma-1
MFLLLPNKQGVHLLPKPRRPALKPRFIASSQRVTRSTPTLSEYNSYKLIYRRYAGLFFTIAVDITDNELSYLETVHLFVELLDSFFSNVCELDIVFNFNKVYSILDEFMLAGEIEETSKKEILDRVKLLEKME